MVTGLWRIYFPEVLPLTFLYVYCRFSEQIAKVKMHCAAKIIQAQNRMEKKASDDTKASLVEMTNKYTGLQKEVEEKVREKD